MIRVKVGGASELVMNGTLGWRWINHNLVIDRYCLQW